MEVDGDSVKHGKHTGGQQVCQICGDGVGTTIHGDLFVACDVCGFPECRPCYEYERKDGNQACPQCKIKYKRHRGSPPIRGEEGGDGDVVDDVSDFNYSTGGQDQKHKIAERMLSWQMNYGRGEDAGLPKYDSGEIPRGHIPMLGHSQQLSGELNGASPDMSPDGGNRKRVHPLPYSDVNHSSNPSREFSGGFGNVAWKERVDGWKIKQDTSTVPMAPMNNSTSHPPSEGRGVGDIDATTDYNMDDALLNDEARQPLSRKVSTPSSRINPYRMVISCVSLFFLSSCIIVLQILCAMHMLCGCCLLYVRSGSLYPGSGTSFRNGSLLIVRLILIDWQSDVIEKMNPLSWQLLTFLSVLWTL